VSTSRRVTVADLEHTPDDGNRYEIIDGELHVSTQLHVLHQDTSIRFGSALFSWNSRGNAGRVLGAPGIIFAPDEAVAPDIVWISHERYARAFEPDGKLHATPELVVEMLSPGRENEERDRDLKLRLYSHHGVREYWIADWRTRPVQVFRRQDASLAIVATLTAGDTLTSPLLPGFAVPVRDLFPT